VATELSKSLISVGDLRSDNEKPELLLAILALKVAVTLGEREGVMPYLSSNMIAERGLILFFSLSNFSLWANSL